MEEPLTPRQRDILVVISRAVEQTGQAPALTAIGEAMGGISSPTVYKHILALEQKGFIRRHPNRRPPIELLRSLPTGEIALPRRVRIVGHLQAGQPLTPVEGDEAYVAADGELLGGETNVVALQVVGYGLAGEGLLDGDLLLVRTGSEAPAGATIVALLDGGGATVRRYVPDEGGIDLVSGQPAGETLRVKQAGIYGAVLAAIRRFR
ncbi:MAG: transcriptional repressor LexA [Chloroflexota bacterium]